MGKGRAKVLIAIALVGGAIIILGFLTALGFSTAGEVAGALGSVIGGTIGAGGAALAVYLTLLGQRDEDRTRIRGSLVREVIEFARLVIGHLETCEFIRSGVVQLPVPKLVEALEMPRPIIYPAIADKIGLLVRPQRVVSFFARIEELGMMVRAYSHNPAAQASVVEPIQIRAFVEALIDVAQFAQLIIEESEIEDDFDRVVHAGILGDLNTVIALTRQNFEIAA
jgi:hypothetical protein